MRYTVFLFFRSLRGASLVFIFLLPGKIFSQNIAINTTGAAGDASAILDLNTGNAGNKGFLPPQVALTATNAAGPVTSPAAGLLVYNTATAGTTPNEVIPGYYYWSGTAWVNMINNSKVTASIPYLLLTASTSGRWYVPGYNVIRDNFNDYFTGLKGPAQVTAQAAYMADNNYVVMSNGTFFQSERMGECSLSGKQSGKYTGLQIHTCKRFGCRYYRHAAWIHRIDHLYNRGRQLQL